MTRTIRAGIIGDYDSLKNSHPAANAALLHSAAALSVRLEFEWLPTPLFQDPRAAAAAAAAAALSRFDCLWASSGSPFKSTAGMLNAIRWARQSGKPFIAT